MTSLCLLSTNRSVICTNINYILLNIIFVFHPEFWKRRGNEAFVSKDYKKAEEAYTKAIGFKGDNGSLWSNRSACYLGLQLIPFSFSFFFSFLFLFLFLSCPFFFSFPVLFLLLLLLFFFLTSCLMFFYADRSYKLYMRKSLTVVV